MKNMSQADEIINNAVASEEVEYFYEQAKYLFEKEKAKLTTADGKKTKKYKLLIAILSGMATFALFIACAISFNIPILIALIVSTSTMAYAGNGYQIDWRIHTDYYIPMLRKVEYKNNDLDKAIMYMKGEVILTGYDAEIAQKAILFIKGAIINRRSSSTKITDTEFVRDTTTTFYARRDEEILERNKATLVEMSSPSFRGEESAQHLFDRVQVTQPTDHMLALAAEKAALIRAKEATESMRRDSLETGAYGPRTR